MRDVVRHSSLLRPFPQPAEEVVVCKGLAPESGERDPCLYKRAIEIEEADKPGPLTRPVCNSEDWTTMTAHSWQNMMSILPRRRCEYQICLWVDVGKDIHPHTLAGVESMPFSLVHGECTTKSYPFLFKAFGKPCFELCLCRP